MPGVSKVTHKGKEVFYFDYSGCKTDDEMLSVLYEARDLVLKDNKPHLQLVDFTDSYTTRTYMQEAKKVAKEVPKLATKRAVIGINSPGRKILLYAYNLVLQGNGIKPFDSKEDALDWLVS